MYWILDVNFNEDLSQISRGHAAENFLILKKLTIIALIHDLDNKKSLGGKRESASWNDDHMAYLFSLTAIKKFLIKIFWLCNTLGLWYIMFINKIKRL